MQLMSAQGGLRSGCILGAFCINRARKVVVLVAGNKKAGVLAEVLEGAKDPQRLPSLAVEPSEGDLFWVIDEAAAAGFFIPPTS